jgi:hypothetical protein
VCFRFSLLFWFVCGFGFFCCCVVLSFVVCVFVLVGCGWLRRCLCLFLFLSCLLVLFLLFFVSLVGLLGFVLCGWLLLLFVVCFRLLCVFVFVGWPFEPGFGFNYDV